MVKAKSPKSAEASSLVKVLSGVSQPIEELHNRGPIVRKISDSLLFAAKSYSLLQSRLEPVPDTLPEHHGFRRVGGVGLLFVWYPEIRRLVLAYSADPETFEESVETYTSPFYLPNHYNGFVKADYAASLAFLHVPLASGTETAETRLQTHCDNLHPESIVVTGYSHGGGLATVAAPWVALCYPSSDVRLVTFGAPRVANVSFRKLLEWAVGVRIRVLHKNDDVTTKGTNPYESEASTLAPIEYIETPDLTVSGSSLAAYIIGVADYCEATKAVTTGGNAQNLTSFDEDSWWSHDHVQTLNILKQVIIGSAKDGSRRGNTIERMVLRNSLLKLSFCGIGAPDPTMSFEVTTGDCPGFVAPDFSLLPDATSTEGSMDTFLQMLAVKSTKQAAMYAEAAYITDVIPQGFIDNTKFPADCNHVCLLTDPVTGADLYVAYYEDTATVVFVARGTEAYSIQDIITDLSFVQGKSDFLSGEGCETQRALQGARAHSGFLAQFNALISGGKNSAQGKTWDYKLRGWVAKELSKNTSSVQMGSDIGTVLSAMTNGRQPLRVICTGHSLGGSVATLAALWAAWSFPDVDVRCIPFGSPLVCNDKLAAAFKEVVGTRIRVVHGKDPVPSVPFTAWGFEHVGPVLFLKQKNKATKVELRDTSCNRGCFVSQLCFHTSDHKMRDGYVAALNKASLSYTTEQSINTEEKQEILTYPTLTISVKHTALAG